MTVLAPSAKLISPTKVWETDEKVYSTATLCNDKNDVKALLDASFGRNLTRAASALVAVLNEETHKPLHEEIVEALKVTHDPIKRR